MNALDDTNALQRAQQNTDLPQRQVRDSRIIRALTAAVLGMGVALLIEGGLCWHLFNATQATHELLYIKLAPQGGYEISQFLPADPQPYYRNTIDGLLERWVQARYGLRPETVQDDYKMAGVFLAQEPYGEFVGAQPGQFNAAQKAADVLAKPGNYDRVEMKLNAPIDYYDAIPGQINNATSEVVRTRIFVTREARRADGTLIGKPKRQIVRLEWHLLDKKTLAQQSADWLRIDPIGLEILRYDLIDDPSDNNSPQAPAPAAHGKKDAP